MFSRLAVGCAVALATVLINSTALQAATIVKPVDAPLVTSEFNLRNKQFSWNGNGLTSDLTTGMAVPLVFPGHTNVPNDNMWHTNSPVASAFIVYDLGQNYLLSGLHVWNYNEVNLPDRSAKDISVSFSTTAPNSGFGSSDVYTLNQSPSANGYAGQSFTLSGIVEARYVRMDILNTYSTPVNNYTGFSEVRFFAPDPGTLATDPAVNGTIEIGALEGETIVLTDAVILENIGTPDSVITIDGFTITGPDAALFDLTNYADAIITGGTEIAFDLEFMTPNENRTFNAVLTFDTNLGDVVFNLQAISVPEPSTLGMVGLASVVAGVRLRRKQRATSKS